MHQAIPYSTGESLSSSLSPPPPPPPQPVPIDDLRHTPVNGASETLQLSCGGGGGSIGGGVSEDDWSQEADMKKVVKENAVVVVGRRGCCMVHVAQKLLLGQGVNPTVCEVGGEADEMVLAVEDSPEKMALPAVFIGGRLVGGLDRLMAVHISGELVPILKQAGALWL